MTPFVIIVKDFFVEGEDGKMTFSFMAGIKGIFSRIYNGIKGWFVGLTSIYKEGFE